MKLQTRVDNDVNVLGLGESRFRAARHLNNAIVVFLALGTGVGGAIIIDGKLVRGSHWSGGELGHILVSMDDVPLSGGGQSVHLLVPVAEATQMSPQLP